MSSAGLNITPEALDIIRQKGKPIYLDLPKVIKNCCFDFQERPSVRFGEPPLRVRNQYNERSLDGIKVFIPVKLPDIPLTITISSFLSFKRLVVEGWSYC
jgi:hypothetical protein